MMEQTNDCESTFEKLQRMLEAYRSEQKQRGLRKRRITTLHRRIKQHEQILVDAKKEYLELIKFNHKLREDVFITFVDRDRFLTKLDAKYGRINWSS